MRLVIAGLVLLLAALDVRYRGVGVAADSLAFVGRILLLLLPPTPQLPPPQLLRQTTATTVIRESTTWRISTNQATLTSTLTTSSSPSRQTPLSLLPILPKCRAFWRPASPADPGPLSTALRGRVPAWTPSIVYSFIPRECQTTLLQ